MKVRIALVTLLLVLVPVGMAMAQQPANLYDTLAAAGNYKTFLSLVDKANVQELKAMRAPSRFLPPMTRPSPICPRQPWTRLWAIRPSSETWCTFTSPRASTWPRILPCSKECKTMCPTDNAGIMHFTMMGDKYMVNNANIVQPDMMATNGVAQGIDAVMLPKFAPPKNL